MELKRAWLSLLCCWFSFYTTAQIIEGKISENGMPVVSANILVKIPDNIDDIVQYTISDFDDNYRIELKEPFDVVLIETLPLVTVCSGASPLENCAHAEEIVNAILNPR